jgi:hypothetical protein
VEDGASDEVARRREAAHAGILVRALLQWKR